MLDDKELAQHETSETSDALLARFRSKVPPLHELAETQEVPEADAVVAIKAKFTDILKDYPDSPDKSLVTDVLSQTLAAGCVAYEIDPLELIIVPRSTQQGENHIAMAERKKVGPFDIKQLFIDPSEIMFRVQLLSQNGETTAKNITDLMFVLMHEAAHLGQAIYAEVDLEKSKRFAYAESPSEIYADEVALGYCRNINEFIAGKPDRNKVESILRIGLPQTIKDAESNRRPSM